MKQKAHVRLEVLILGALLLFLALARFVKLDARPLTDSEAVHALTASESTQDASEFWPNVADAGASSPLYHFLARIIIQNFGATDLTTRLVPAIAGYLILLLLVIQYRELKPGSKLIWLLLLGFSPVMLTSSRIVADDILAAAALFPVFLIFLSKDDAGISHPHIVIALATGIGLTAGSSVFKALTGIAITLIVAFSVQHERFKESTGVMGLREGKKTAWLIPVVAVIVLSGFGSSLEGIRGFALSLEEWLLGWAQSSGYSFIELMLLLVTSEPLIVLFGIIGSVRLWAKRDQQGWLVSLWAVSAGLFMLVYRGRSPSDLIWLIMPLSYLSVHAIMELFDSIGDLRSNLELIGLLGLLITFVASGALSFVAYGTGNVLTINPNNPNLVLFLFLALAVMGLSVLVFFGVGWSWRVVVHAVGILLLLLSIAQGISSLWRLNYSNEGHQVANLWWQTTPADGLPLIVQSLEHTAMAYSGQEDMLPIEVQGDLPASLAWALRGFERLEGETAFGVEAPPVILTPEGDVAANLPADYIGQSLGIRESRAWDSALPPDFIKWWIRREAPVSIEPWVLWVRADVASFGEIGLEN